MSMPALANTENLNTFTFVTEKAGSTTIDQVEARDVMDAVLRWSQVSQTCPGDPVKYDEPIPIEGVTNVWCIAGHDPGGAFYLAHIIATITD